MRTVAITPLYCPPDVKGARRWGANCGPAALAAALGCWVADVFEAVADPPPSGELPGLESPRFRGYMGINQMREALRRARAKEVARWSTPTLEVLRQSPHVGLPILACIQWGGPWVGTSGAPVYRHWVTLRWIDGGWAVYDVNAQHLASCEVIDGTVSPHRVSQLIERRWGGWLWLDAWKLGLKPRLAPSRGDGTWTLQWAAAVKA